MIFEWMRDPVSVRMAAFTTENPDDRERFDRWFAGIRARPDVILKAITLSGTLVGTISTFLIEGDREVTYWLDRAVWGRGIAGRALEEMLRLDTTRPLAGRAASANVASVKVLLRTGFTETGRDVGFAAGMQAEIEETILRLDA